jgi:hypothetical protein
MANRSQIDRLKYEIRLLENQISNNNRNIYNYDNSETMHVFTKLGKTYADLRSNNIIQEMIDTIKQQIWKLNPNEEIETDIKSVDDYYAENNQYASQEEGIKYLSDEELVKRVYDPDSNVEIFVNMSFKDAFFKFYRTLGFNIDHFKSVNEFCFNCVYSMVFMMISKYDFGSPMNFTQLREKAKQHLDLVVNLFIRMFNDHINEIKHESHLDVLFQNMRITPITEEELKSRTGGKSKKSRRSKKSKKNGKSKKLRK